MNTNQKVTPKIFKRTDFGNMKEMKVQVINPLTNCEYVHIAGIEKIDGDDNYKAWAGRGDAVKVHFWDENGGTFSLCFGFHKGATFAWVENVIAEGQFEDESV